VSFPSPPGTELGTAFLALGGEIVVEPGRGERVGPGTEFPEDGRLSEIVDFVPDLRRRRGVPEVVRSAVKSIDNLALAE